MARTRRIKREGDASYHIMSRINGREFLLKEPGLKNEIIDILRKTATFSGVFLRAYCIMDDHFHIVASVVKPDHELTEAEIVERIACLKGRETADEIANHWADLRRGGMSAAVDEQLAGWRRRMHDVSQFAKTFKELVNVAYKKRHSHVGGLWEGRFKSTWVQDGAYLRTVIRYVELNPVRAGLVSQAKDYAFSSHNSFQPVVYGPFAGSP